MSHASAAQRYRAVQLESARPQEILLALYDGCIRFCKAARIQIEDGDLAGKGVSIGKAVAILGELRSTLDHERAPELCERLDQLYLFFQEQLSLANIELDPTLLDPVIALMGDLREAWAEAIRRMDEEQAA